MVLASQYNGWWDQVNAIRTEFEVANVTPQTVASNQLTIHSQLNALIKEVTKLNDITGSTWADPQQTASKNSLMVKPQKLIDRLDYLDDLCNHSSCCVGNCCVSNDTCGDNPCGDHNAYLSPYATENNGYAGKAAGEKGENSQPNTCTAIVT